MEDLKDFIKISNKRLDTILKKLQLTREDVLKNSEEPSLNDSKVNEKEEEEPFPDTFHIGPNTVEIAPNDLAKILGKPPLAVVTPPEKFSDLQTNFSREDKLKIYEHVIEQTKDYVANIPQHTGLVSPEDESALADIVAVNKREQNRRKRKFRTSKPTHIEEVRGVVELQMQALHQYLNNEIVPKGSEVHQSNKSRSQSHTYSNRVDRTTESKESHRTLERYGKERNYHHKSRYKDYGQDRVVYKDRHAKESYRPSSFRSRSPVHQRKRRRSRSHSRSHYRHLSDEEDLSRHHRSRDRSHKKHKNHKEHKKHKHKSKSKKRHKRHSSKSSSD